MVKRTEYPEGLYDDVISERNCLPDIRKPPLWVVWIALVICYLLNRKKK